MANYYLYQNVRENIGVRLKIFMMLKGIVNYEGVNMYSKNS